MSEPEIDAVVFDVLGTLVVRTRRYRRRHSRTRPIALYDPRVEELLALRQQHIDHEQRRMLDGGPALAPLTSDVLDLEAARLVADAAGVDDPAAVAALALSGRRLPPWPDTVAGSARLAERFPLDRTLQREPDGAVGTQRPRRTARHQALSAEDARTYKPDPAVYQPAVTVSGRPPDRLLMVAAHAWDLRGAQRLGLRTADVARPVGDPPTSSDGFDLHADDLAGLADQLDHAPGDGHARDPSREAGSIRVRTLTSPED